MSWKELGSWTQKPGIYKWNSVYLEEDTNNKFLTNLMQKGYRLDDGSDLINPKLAFAHAGSFIQVGGNAWNISQAEEEVEEKIEKTKEKIAQFDGSKLDYGVASYIG